MRFLKMGLILSALAIPLMAASCNERIQQTLPEICAAEVVVYNHYRAVADGGLDTIPARYKNDVEFAHLQMNKLCVNPSQATTLTVLAAASNVYSAVRAAYMHGGAAGAKALPKLEKMKRDYERMWR